MAERRMIAKTIIDSDAFHDLSIEAQALYFNLAIVHTDDDGFCNKPKSALRELGLPASALEELIASKFIYAFPSGIVVIKHWLIHNLIRKDAYNETKYKEEKYALYYDENGAYTTTPTPLPVTHLLRSCNDVVTEALQLRNGSVTEALQDCNKSLTQDRLGKERKGKDRLGKGNNKPAAAKNLSTSDALNVIADLRSQYIEEVTYEASPDDEASNF